MLTLAQAHALLPGSTLVGDGALPLQRVHSDTRTLRAGDLFVALRGERFDGHDHLPAARAAGAVAALAERGLGDRGSLADLDDLADLGGPADLADRADLAGVADLADGDDDAPHTLPGLLVPDSLQALQQLAAAWRARFAVPPSPLQLIAVTGSNGKTTVTQMVASILRAWLGAGDSSAALATAGNFNNHIGVPLTLLRLRGQHRAAVLELGMNHPGEIALLARMAAPTVALVNNAQREHQEFMSTVEAVARENGSVIDALASDGTVVVPVADAFTPLWRSMAGTRKVTSFGLDAGADVHAQSAWQTDAQRWALTLRTPAGSVVTTLAQAGVHNVHNALAAAACALAAGAPLAAVAQGIAAFRPVAGRSQLLPLHTAHGPVTLIDDSYNANPDSVLAAIDVLAGLPGPRWLVLGDMGEVGSEGPRFHAEVGAQARAKGIEFFWAAGALSTHAGAHRHFDNTAALLSALPQEKPRAVASVLVKGSRFMQMEQVVQWLKHDAQAEGRACC